MQTIRRIELHPASREEKLPGFTDEFPYIATRAELNYYREHFVPWHWHRAVELFYMESGSLEYHTPGRTVVFPAGSGGMVNSNVLHMTRILHPGEKNVQLLHIFDPCLLAGERGSRIEQKYISPLVTAPQLELIALSPVDPAQAEALALIRQAFRLEEAEFGYELKLREALSEIWLRLWALSAAARQSEPCSYQKSREQIKQMLGYIHEHCTEKLSIPELAAAAYLSERECYRLFQTCLHTTPSEYIRSIRLQLACRMLAEGQAPVTAVGSACGLGSSSYFGKVFRESMGCTPLEYRRKWQNHDKNRRK